MKKIKAFLFAIIALVVIVVVVGFFLPATAHVERTTVVDASQTTVFTLLNSYKTFQQWSPWFERDPIAEYTYEGPESGVGAKMSWKSEKPDVGSGSQEITGSVPYSEITTHLDFGDQGTANAFFHIKPVGEQTEITWGFDTEFGFNIVGRYMGLLFDRMLGPDYEKGLNSFKTLVEGYPKGDWSDLEIEVVEVAPLTVAYTSASSHYNHEAMGSALADAYGEVMQYLGRARVRQAAAPIAITRGLEDSTWSFDACIPIGGLPHRAPAVGSSVQIGETYGGRAIRAVHVGPYSEIPDTYSKLEACRAAMSLETNGDPWEQFISDPGTTDEAKLITHIYVPVM